MKKVLIVALLSLLTHTALADFCPIGGVQVDCLPKSDDQIGSACYESIEAKEPKSEYIGTVQVDKIPGDADELVQYVLEVDEDLEGGPTRYVRDTEQEISELHADLIAKGICQD